jgi:multiple sugar transport system ATP-binding protein
MAGIRLEKVTKAFVGGVVAVDDVNLTIADGEFMVLVGPSGCGKSTLLRMMAGLEEVTSGTIAIGGRDVTRLAPQDRDVAMVFQNYALYPHYTVRKNLAYGLRVRRTPKAEIERRVAEVAQMLGLEELLERRPSALSGGQRQRVAMGRAIVRNPQVFLMDEPLSNLDAKLRVQTRTQIAALQRRLNVTTIYVTHDQVEAMTMGDRVAVLRDGVLQQVDKPRNLFARPANVFVAGFIGSPQMNLREVAVVDGSVELAGYRVPLPASQAAAQPRVVIGIRPESFEPAEAGIPIRVDVVEELGSDAYVYGRLGESNGGHEVVESDVVARIDPRRIPEPGDVLRVAVREESLHVFSAETGERVD